MNWKDEWKPLALILAIFFAAFYLPVGIPRFDNAVSEAFQLTKWYAREHVVLCLIPAFFIAGAISVFVNQAAVMRYLGAKAKRTLAYGVASVSGTILAVCSCTVLPLFAGIYKRGAGLGPAIAFLYSGPAINVLAIVMTARIMGLELGVARAVGAVVFSVVIGLLMAFIYRKDETARNGAQADAPMPEGGRPLWQTAVYFAAMVGVLVFANWGKSDQTEVIWYAIWSVKWYLTAGFAILLAVLLNRWFSIPFWQVGVASLIVLGMALAFPEEPVVTFGVGAVALSVITSLRTDESGDWFAASWGFAKQITPLLLFGVLAAGFALGRPGHEGIIPSQWVSAAVGGNGVGANFFASIAGAFMYFATLTEVPIVQGLLGAGMGKGPALALLLAGPALSLPSMLVIRTVVGTGKTITYVSLVVVMATISGLIYGAIFA
ncbi:MAG TPA: permease [Candidatus Latescibacteria bacterium]|nr:permease [Candidatus Latescibacterota bacterium]HOS63149.1 permease [Candidatus Latescibacterota bacterium]HPK75214.1 permease [Candidatus Latescibacterota bacterium]